LVIQDQSSTHCSNTTTELIVDYSMDFTMCEIFQTHEALKNGLEKLVNHMGLCSLLRSLMLQEMKRNRACLLVVSEVVIPMFTNTVVNAM